MNSRSVAFVLVLFCSGCALWEAPFSAAPSVYVPPPVATVPPATQTVVPAATAQTSSVGSDARSPSRVEVGSLAPVSNDHEAFACTNGGRLIVRYSPDRSIARISLDGGSPISLSRTEQEGYLAYEARGMQFRRSGPRAVFVGGPDSIVVRRGDTLGAIARRLYGQPVQAQAIAMANTDTITDPNLIRVGQTLRLPNSEHWCRRTLV